MTLTLGSLPPWLVAALGPLPAQGGGLRWSFLLVSPLLAATLLLASAYGTARKSTGRGAGSDLTLAGILFIILATAMAMPILVFPRLPPATARLVLLSRLPEERLSAQAMSLSDPQRRLEFALSLYLRTGRPAMFLDGTGNPAIFIPGPDESSDLALARWLAARPGALPGERRALALVDLLLIFIILGGLPLVIRSRENPAPSARPPG
jgi:hypothetical protein